MDGPSPDPTTIYGPTPNWTPSPRTDAPAPNQQRDWTPPTLCDPRNPYWTEACDAMRAQPMALVLVDDELRAIPAAVPVPEPTVLALLLGAALWKLRR